MLLTDRRYFENVMCAIGRTMLLFLLFCNLYDLGIGFLDMALYFSVLTPVAYNVIYQLICAAGYMLVFMLPVLFLHRFLHQFGCTVKPMALTPQLSPMLLPIVFAGITVCFAMADINASIVDLFNYSNLTADTTVSATVSMAPYEIVLDFIAISLVPAFCEEFLFRGAILTNLRPFGRTNAVLISAVLFALMHQNAGQFLYTFAAGIVLGLVYEYTDSIWSCVILHLFNNFISVVQNTVLAKYGESLYAASVLTLLDVLIYLLGAISIGILVCRHFLKKKVAEDGVFEKTLSVSDSYAETPIHGRVVARIFFRPSIIAFVILASVMEVVSLLFYPHIF